jgi:hypothetical protein
VDEIAGSLLQALDRVAPELRALAESVQDEDADPSLDEAAGEQFLRAFEALLREGFEGRRDQRDLVMETAVPALVATGQSSAELVEGHVAFFVILSARLLEEVPANLRDQAGPWLARYAGDYVREVTERAQEAERAEGGSP